MTKLKQPFNAPLWLKDFARDIERNLDAAPVSYTVATVPDATVNTGRQFLITNETGGATMAFSDGTNWRRVQDRAIIS